MAGRFDWLVDWIEGCSYSVRNEHPRAIARYQRLLSVNGPSAHVLVRIAISYNSIGKNCVQFHKVQGFLANFCLVFKFVSIMIFNYYIAGETLVTQPSYHKILRSI